YSWKKDSAVVPGETSKSYTDKFGPCTSEQATYEAHVLDLPFDETKAVLFDGNCERPVLSNCVITSSFLGGAFAGYCDKGSAYSNGNRDVCEVTDHNIYVGPNQPITFTYVQDANGDTQCAFTSNQALNVPNPYTITITFYEDVNEDSILDSAETNRTSMTLTGNIVP
ncbi:MAG: hypothetical protein ACE5DM_02465, partial [Candidatus Nanoarchaeia archaeon]